MTAMLQYANPIAATSAIGRAPKALLQRKCACGGTPGPTGECAACRQKRLAGAGKIPPIGTAEQNGDNRHPANGPTAFASWGHQFGRLRVAADSRCPLDGSCPKNPLVDYQGSGETSCNTATGQMETTLTEHCAGDCVAQHEAVHREDRAECCSGVKRCLDAASTPQARQLCMDRFADWFPRLSDWTECNAYTREVNCLTNLIAAQCSGAAGNTACCRTLSSELAFATRQRDTHCTAASFAACPFPSGPGDFPLPAPNGPRLA